MKKIYLSLWMVFLAISSFAQKLPDIQTSNMAAPATVKIDGKTTEWNDSFAAENKRTELFYSIANDDKNLYLVLKSSSTTGSNKIMMGGITFLINTDGKKKEKDAITVTYPLIVRANRAQGGRGGQNRQGGGQGGFQNRTQQSTQQRDSIALVLHKTQLATVKEIKISGFKTITDSLISIYNEHGIKAVASFDQKGIYTCEFAIPLNLLGLSANDTKEFAYQIKVNGLSNMNFGGNGGGFGGNGGGFGGNGRGGGGFTGGNNAGSGQDLMSPTDFWGKYSLAKK
ncbi:hypothetical protein GM921_00010 [Pedobacter sp. LMG 31464]|uniref:T9SS C-terminal target domain-containing protein n=1 Tax=Pedobacter planticolens TaxID=2679964 RepID=A0A923DWQ1_9SPHI|nr:hypothetical protein [Pedobacter planticolens]MBB2143853.1 hypothetical protein [Pedobacter planticolens]